MVVTHQDFFIAATGAAFDAKEASSDGMIDSSSPEENKRPDNDASKWNALLDLDHMEDERSTSPVVSKKSVLDKEIDEERDDAGETLSATSKGESTIGNLTTFDDESTFAATEATIDTGSFASLDFVEDDDSFKTRDENTTECACGDITIFCSTGDETVDQDTNVLSNLKHGLRSAAKDYRPRADGVEESDDVKTAIYQLARGASYIVEDAETIAEVSRPQLVEFVVNSEVIEEMAESEHVQMIVRSMMDSPFGWTIAQSAVVSEAEESGLGPLVTEALAEPAETDLARNIAEAVADSDIDAVKSLVKIDLESDLIETGDIVPYSHLVDGMMVELAIEGEAIEMMAPTVSTDENSTGDSSDIGISPVAADGELQSTCSFAAGTTGACTIEGKQQAVKAKKDVPCERGIRFLDHPSPQRNSSKHSITIKEVRPDVIEIVYDLEETFPDDTISTLPTFLAGEDTRNASKNNSTNAMVKEKDGTVLRCVLNQPSFRRELALRYIQAVISRRGFATFLYSSSVAAANSIRSVRNINRTPSAKKTLGEFIATKDNEALLADKDKGKPKAKARAVTRRKGPEKRRNKLSGRLRVGKMRFARVCATNE